MPHTPKRWSFKGVAFAASLTVVFAACGNSASSPSASSAPATTAPSTAAGRCRSVASTAAFDRDDLSGRPVTRPCGVAPYTGNMKKITAIDALTVEFQLCNPDAAFLPKVAFSAFGIQDSRLPREARAGRLDPRHPERHRPLQVQGMGARATGSSGKPTPTTGATRPRPPTAELHWSDESAARLLDLQSGTVDGIDNPGSTDIATIQGDSSLKFYPRAGLNTLFLGFNNTQKPFDDVRVRQAIAMGIDRDQIVKNFFPAGSTVADYFTPCEIPFACKGDKTWGFDPTAAKALLAAGGLPGRQGPERRHQLPRGGPWLQPEPAGHRHRDRPAAQEEPRASPRRRSFSSRAP